MKDDVGTIHRFSDDKELDCYIRLRVSSYFPLKVPISSSGKGDYEHFLRDGEKITKCRNGIVLKANLKSWLGDIDFKKISPAFQIVLQKHVQGLKAFGLTSQEAEKLSIVVSRNLSWSEGISLVKDVYGKSNTFHVNINTLEDSLFLIFLRISSPRFLDYPFSFLLEEERKKKISDEKFFNSCMESAITRYMKEVDKYTGSDPLDECERHYGLDYERSSDKKKLD